MMQCIRMKGIWDDEWFKKNYVFVCMYDDEDINFDDVEVVFDDFKVCCYFIFILCLWQWFYFCFIFEGIVFFFICFVWNIVFFMFDFIFGVGIDVYVLLSVRMLVVNYFV